MARGSKAKHSKPQTSRDPDLSAIRKDLQRSLEDLRVAGLVIAAGNIEDAIANIDEHLDDEIG